MHDFIRYAYRYIGIGLGSHVGSRDLRFRRQRLRIVEEVVEVVTVVEVVVPSGVEVVEVVDVVEVVVLGVSGLRTLAFRASESTGFMASGIGHRSSRTRTKADRKSVV